MQPASGARDLNPQQVEINHLIATNLSNVYKLWGYEEVSPPNIERLETLMAGDAISNKDILKVVADDQLGLRPEMTASIARAASTRFVNRPRPLRLWSKGTVFKSKEVEVAEGGTYIEECLHSGIELFGVKNINAEIELLSVLIESLEALKLKDSHEPTLLIGHKKLMDLILTKFNSKEKRLIRSVLTNYDQIAINNLNIEESIKKELIKINELRGDPQEVFKELADLYGEHEILNILKKLFDVVIPISRKYNIRVQLDPTFQTSFDLYNGLIFQLVCNGISNKVVIARGGRYDQIVKRFNENSATAAGVGFIFAIDKTREIIIEDELISNSSDKILVAFGPNKSIEDALIKQRELHSKGQTAILQLDHCVDKIEALKISESKNFRGLVWIE